VYTRSWERTAGRDDPNRPKGHPVPYGIKLSDKSWGKEWGGGKFRVMVLGLPTNSYTW